MCLVPGCPAQHFSFVSKQKTLPLPPFHCLYSLLHSISINQFSLTPSLSRLPISTSLLQRNKPRTVRRANTGPSVLDRLVTDAELAQIEPNHLRLDLDLVELLARVDANDRANHLGHDNHVAQVRLDEVGLLVGLCGLFGFTELLDQAHRLALEAAVEAATGTGVDDVAKLFGGEVEKSIDGG